MSLPLTSPVGRSGRAGRACALLLGLGLGVRLVGLDQPIVENYVGRQVPTAMVARNLERGSGFLNPCLDVAPFPNRFLVEPPVYAEAAVATLRATGLPLDAAGRAVSALGVVLAAWGLFGLASRREGEGVALGAVAVFLALPVTLRYGRAFQPDALMVGCLLAGLRLCDDCAHGGGRVRLAAGLALVAAGLALKVVSVYVLIPLVLVVLRPYGWRAVGLAALTLAPAALWYAHAGLVLAAGVGSRASADNGGIWLAVLVPRALLRVETFAHVGRFLFVRSFTPLGPPLAAAGLWLTARRPDRLWTVWGASALVALAALAAKLHHEYYWLAVAPVAAVGIARALAAVGRRGAAGRLVAGGLGAGLLGLALACSASTWRTPPEWASLRDAAGEVGRHVPAGAWVVAPEALLHAADRRGCRLELTPTAALRAAGEWGEPLGGSGPPALVEFYRRHGAAYFADVRPADAGPDRLALHDAVRRRYNVVVDRPGVLIARLTEPDPRVTTAWPRTPRPARPTTDR